MTVFLLKFRDHSPSSMWTRAECFHKLRKRLVLQRRAIDQRHHGIVATAVQDLPQSNLKRTELTALGSWVDDQIRSAAVDNRAKIFYVCTADNNYQFAMVGKRPDGCREKCSSREVYACPVNLRPGQ